MPELKKILIVDDEPDAIEIAKAILSEIDGITIDSANDADSGLAKAREIMPDLVMLDIDMPGKNGLYVFSELRKDAKTEKIPIIMVTGLASELGVSFNAEDMKNHFGSRPEAYIEKPADPVALQETVKKILNI